MLRLLARGLRLLLQATWQEGIAAVVAELLAASPEPSAARVLLEATQLHHADLATANTRDAPDAVVPSALMGVQIDGEQLRARLRPASWNVIVTRVAMA